MVLQTESERQISLPSERRELLPRSQEHTDSHMLKGSSNDNAHSVPVLRNNGNQNQNISFGLTSNTRSILKNNPEK